MTAAEAQALGWCTKRGCTCDATNHFPPEGTELVSALTDDTSAERNAGRRRRWLYTQGGQPLEQPLEVTDDWKQPDSGPSLRSEAEVYGNLTPATDGTRLDSKRRHHEYMARNNLTIAEDFKNTWAQAEVKRERMATGDFDHQRRRETIGRAAYELEKKGRQR